MGLMLRSTPSDSRVVGRSVITGSALSRPLLGVCDALVIMLADESDDCRDVVRYWGNSVKATTAYLAAGSSGAGAIDYPWVKRWLVGRRICSLSCRSASA